MFCVFVCMCVVCTCVVNCVLCVFAACVHLCVICVYMCVVSYVLCVYASVHLYAGVYVCSCVCLCGFSYVYKLRCSLEIARYLVHSRSQFLFLITCTAHNYIIKNASN